MTAESEPRVTDNPREQRYELWVADARAGVIEYRADPGTVWLIHTEVDPAFEGRGLGARLVRSALDDIRGRGLKLVAICPFVRAYLRRHPDQRDLIDPTKPVRP